MNLVKKANMKLGGLNYYIKETSDRLLLLKISFLA